MEVTVIRTVSRLPANDAYIHRRSTCIWYYFVDKAGPCY